MNLYPKSLSLLIGLFSILIINLPTSAAPPTEEAVEKWIAKGVWDDIVAAHQAFRASGGDSPEEHSPIDRNNTDDLMALGVDVIDTAIVIVILVDFSDNPYTVGGVAAEPYQFDSVLFSEGYYNPAGSMTDFYLENSYGNFVVKGDIFGWYRMSETYAYYVGDDYGLSRSQELTSKAVDSVRNYVSDWNRYDSNNDGYCDGLVIIHSGGGAETGVYGIWSHKSSIPTVIIDGVRISAYTMNPEEYSSEISPIGVYCHEYGHFLGLPDLYDISGAPNSNGLGNWALMATGSYNGDSRYPSHLTAWSKAELGFLQLTDVDENLNQISIPNVEDNPVAYRLQNSLSTNYEHWIVENRQQVGFDVGLPASGLCIYHVDDHAPGPSNQNPDWYHVAMEQADGDNALAYSGSRGDAGDVWPGSSNSREFHDLTLPNSRTNLLGPFSNNVTTRIGLWEISNSDMTMTADLDEDWSRPWPLLADHDSVMFDDSQPGGDGDGILEPGETISFYCQMKNVMRVSYNAIVRLETNNPSVTFGTNEVLLALQFDGSGQSNLTPITFTLAQSFIPTIDSFFLTVECDSIAGTPYDSWTSKTFGLEADLGPPQILIVDDDRGSDYEEVYHDILYRQRIPHAIHHKDPAGSPSGSTLQQYRMVFWHTGDFADPVFTAADVTAMTSYLDAGGSLLISSISGAKTLNDLDVGFLNNYLGANWTGTLGWPFFQGVTGSQLGDGTKYRYEPSVPSPYDVDLVTLVDSSEAAMTLGGRTEICCVTYQGLYNSILITFPIEYLSDQFSTYNTKETLIMRVVDFFGGIPAVGSSCCEGIRGDIADPMDGIIDITDLVYLIDYMFLSGPAPTCMAEADVNADGADQVDISDLMYLIDYMFTGGPPPAACP